ncbi:MAG: helix-turn-helix transcriptional regulator [Clostridia bacterium]|nr:helix-turn-helix transcriptional regulator [Clostridia bacterium]
MENKAIREFIQVNLPGIQISVVQKFMMDKQEEIPVLHKHPCYEIIYVNKRDEKYFILIPPNTEHLAIDGRKEDIISVNSFLLSFKGKGSSVAIYNVLKNLSEAIRIEDTFGGLNRIKSIQKLSEDNSFGFMEQLTAEFQLLIVLLCRAIGKTSKSAMKNFQTLDEKRLCILEDYFTYNFASPSCSKKELALLLGVCERQLTRIIEKQYNSSFSEVLLTMRMNMARAMIEENKVSIEKIVEKVGYESVSAFQRAYKRFFGETVKNSIKGTKGQ